MEISQTKISDLEDKIGEKLFIRIENWNLYVGDAGLARKLAIECLSNLNKRSQESARISLESIRVKIGDGHQDLPLSKLITSSQAIDLVEILDSIT